MVLLDIVFPFDCKGLMLQFLFRMFCGLEKVCRIPRNSFVTLFTRYMYIFPLKSHCVHFSSASSSVIKLASFILV